MAVTAAAAGRTAILIDDFNSGDYSIVASNSVKKVEAVRAGSMIGGQRDVLLEHLNGPLTVSSIVMGGLSVSFFNSDSQTRGRLTVQYDGFDGELETDLVQTNGMGLNHNFSNEYAIYLMFPFVNASMGQDVSVTARLITNTGTLSLTKLVGQGYNKLLTMPLSSFTGVGNLTNVRRIEFVFSGPPSADFTLDRIATNVPGPAALLPFLAGAMGLARRRRTR